MAARRREAILAEIDAAWHDRALRVIDDEDFLAPERKPQSRLDKLLWRNDERDVEVGHIAAGDRLAETGHGVKRRGEGPLVRAERLSKFYQAGKSLSHGITRKDTDKDVTRRGSCCETPVWGCLRVDLQQSFSWRVALCLYCRFISA